MSPRFPPISLVAAGVTDLREAQMVVPAVRFQAEGNNTQVFVRGVGANLDFANVEPNVAFNFAGIYLPREATSAAFFDVAQLEILPGSQGTLYGRSAIGGTIVLSPDQARLQLRRRSAAGGRQLLGRARHRHPERQGLGYGGAARRQSTMPTTMASRTTGADSKNDISVRLSTLIKPLDGLTIYRYAQGAQKHGHTENLVNKGTDPTTGAYCEALLFLLQRLERYAHRQVRRSVRHHRRRTQPLQAPT